MNSRRNSVWGLLPEDVREILRRREWENASNLKSRILDERPFPIRIGLKPSSSKHAIADMAHFQRFVGEWKLFEPQRFVEWTTRSYRTLSTQNVPVALVLQNLNDLAEFIGEDAQSRRLVWTRNMTPIMKTYKDAHHAMVRNLTTVEGMSESDSELLAELVPQLQAGMGRGGYLRALPLIKVDTKFLETYQSLVTDILDILNANAVSESGGLYRWLNCVPLPKGWILIRPLCESAKAKMGNLPLLQVPEDVFETCPLPASNILIVENQQSGLGLPEFEDTIAIIGLGNNTACLKAPWLSDRRVAYWGDIDSWGLTILSRVRERLKDVATLMMDHETLLKYRERMVYEKAPADNCPEFLDDVEGRLFRELQDGTFTFNRLEQERLSPDYISSKIQAWIDAEV